MATLTVTTSEDYRDGTPPLDPSTTDIDFANTTGLAAATFGSNQFASAGGPISDSVDITGNAEPNEMIVRLAATGIFSAAGWSISNWDDSVDGFEFFGTGGDDTITGTSKDDAFETIFGTDTLAGGAGNDVFRIGAGATIGATSSFDGGAGDNDILILSAVTLDLSSATLAGLDKLILSGTSGATFNGTQLAFGAIDEVQGDTGQTQSLIVGGNSVDLSGLAFFNWTDGTDTITINGTSGVDTLTGSSKNDIIDGGVGADSESGGAGDDVFRLGKLFGAGASIDGGADTDSLLIESSNFFSQGTLQSIERIVFGGADAAIFFREDQFGAGLIADNLSLTGGAFFHSIQVDFLSPGAFSAAGWTFSNWTDTASSILLLGSTGVDAITGSARLDTIQGSGGADILSGGEGDDAFRYTPGDAVAGEQINGDDGTDSLVVAGNTVSFVDVALAGIERVEFFSDAQATAIVVLATQIGAGLITQVAGSADLDIFAVNAASDVDLSGMTFANWTSGTDAINIFGTGDGESLTGSSQNDTFAAGAGNDVLTGGAGNDALFGDAGTDTAVFSGNVSSYTLQVVGKTIVVSGPDGTDTLSAIERLQFADHVHDLDDGSVLFDTPFYLSQNPDVFQLGIDALSHYDFVGFQEGRDPNALFDTSGYLAVNADVRASGVNPLDHFDQFGWQQGHDPSADFDTTLYLINNPDVAAAGINPLAHFLQVGSAEGRQAFAAIGQNIVDGFDAQFYLFHNPDVAAAGIDPFLHYDIAGRFEGRNPNAWFDTAGYLSHYTDVAAAGINPLLHYALTGWTEGRDPSATFDTLGYLAANPDVAAAGINPLEHFLRFGIYEGRTPVNDGVFF